MSRSRQDIVLRADAAARMGTGHVMRCLALAQAARALGMHVHMVCRIGVEWVRLRLQQEEIPLQLVEGEPPYRETPEDLSAQLGCFSGLFSSQGMPTWVVLDGYHFGAECQKALLDRRCKLLVIDDYAHLPEYNCHLLLNQNVGADGLAYCGNIERTLLGPQYALLRQEFRLAREKALLREPSESPQTLLVNLGGGDFIEHLEVVAATLRQTDIGVRTIRVIQGAMSAERIRNAFAGCSVSPEILPCVDDMASLLLDTDVCITAGGSTCWELCCLGVPFLTLTLAENQKGIVRWLEKEADVAPFSSKNLRRLLSSKTRRLDQKRVIMDLVTGWGAMNIARIMRKAVP